METFIWSGRSLPRYICWVSATDVRVSLPFMNNLLQRAGFKRAFFKCINSVRLINMNYGVGIVSTRSNT